MTEDISDAAKAAKQDMRESIERVDRNGEHDWYLIGTHTQKCSKCRCVKDFLFSNTVYLPRPTVRLQTEPICK